MAHPHAELLEIILRECAAAQPQPWYPGEYARSTGVPREPLDTCLDQLRLAGLVKLTPWVQGNGQGYQLTPLGSEVLERPRQLDRLRQGQVPQRRSETEAPPVERHALAGMRGEMVRDALLDDSRPLMTQLLLALNILWFFVGFLVFHLRYGGAAGEYFSLNMATGGAKHFLTDIDTGSLFIVNLLDHNQWWRLLSYGFLHGGVLHIGMNMYALYVLGPLLEKMWGRAAFLAVYLASCVGGGAAAMVFSPQSDLVGASGAICGLLGSMATWVFVNRNFLPPHIVSAWRNNIIQNVVLITIISFMPGISLAGHAGGFIAGAIVSAPLSMARFGSGPRRVLGWLGMLAVSIVGLCLMVPSIQRFSTTELMAGLRQFEVEQRRRVDHADRDAEDDRPARPRKNRAAQGKLDPAKQLLLRADEAAVGICNSALTAVIRPQQRDALDIAKAGELQKSFLEQQAFLEAQIAALKNAAASASPELHAAIDAGLAWFVPTAQFSGKTAKICEAGRRITAGDRMTLQADLKQLVKFQEAFKAAWEQIDQ